MSSPTFTKAYKDGVEVGCVSHNWGWMSPSHYEIAVKFISIVNGAEIYGVIQQIPDDWDYLIDRFMGKLTRKNYELMYRAARDVHLGRADKKEFNVDKYLEEL